MLIYIPVLLLALTIHEFAHGYMAWYKGDNTAKENGRLSLNPLTHLDLWGTITFFVTLNFLPFPFGWAKPVPVNPMNLDNPKRDMAYVAFAGPLSNMILALIAGYFYIWFNGGIFPIYIQELFKKFIIVNIGLAFINLLPIPPLDGSNILRSFLPPNQLMSYIRFTRYVPQIFIGLILLGSLTGIPFIIHILLPILRPWLYLWYGIIFGGRIPF